MEDLKFEVETVEDIPRVAKLFLDEVGHRKIFAFQGEMGVGKTSFIIQLLKCMGIEHPEGSPTYSLVNTYESPMFGEVLHFDLYRLNDEYEAIEAGVEELFYSNSVCFIEWPEKAKGILPIQTVWVNLKRLESNCREITIKL